MSQIEVPFSSQYKILGDKNQSQKKQRHVFFGDIHICIYIWLLIKIPLSENGHFLIDN
jgi:hypothetical protein